jgi:hypothetical protein
MVSDVSDAASTGRGISLPPPGSGRDKEGFYRAIFFVPDVHKKNPKIMGVFKMSHLFCNLTGQASREEETDPMHVSFLVSHK